MFYAGGSGFVEEDLDPYKLVPVFVLQLTFSHACLGEEESQVDRLYEYSLIRRRFITARPPQESVRRISK